MNPKTASRSVPELVLIALLALVPVVFERLTQECFEIPQAALLATGALVLLGYALAREAGRKAPSTWGTRLLSWAARDPLGVGVLLFLLSAIASTVASPNPAQSLHGAPDSTSGLVAALSTALVYFASRSVSHGDPRVLLRFARAAGFASAIASGYALLQLTGLDPLIWGRTASYDGAVRIFGTLGHPNMLGAYLAMTAPLTVWLAVRARGGAERILWALVATASVVTIAATLSRGAWIGLGAGAIAVPLLAWIGKGSPADKTPAGRARPRSRLPAAVLVSLAAALVAILFFARTPMGPHVLDRVRQLTSLSAPTTQSRLHIWRAAWRMFQDHPVWGVGLDAFGILFPRYRTAAYWRVEWGRTPNKAHNEGLQILATQGLVGGIAALLVLALAVRAILRAVRRSEGDARWGSVVAGASLVAFAVQDLASFTVVALGSLAAAMAGWVSAAAEGAPPGRRAARATPVWARVAAAAAMLALFVPLVIQPLRAQVEEKVALQAPVGSPDRADRLIRAAALAPWDGRYGNFLGVSLLTQAGREPSVERARDLLRRGVEAQRKAIAVEPENSYYYSNLGRIAAFQAGLRPPEASISDVRSIFGEALARDSVNAEIMDHAAQSLIQLGQPGEARGIAVRTAALYPDLAQPLGLIGYTALLERRWADAADTLALAVKRAWYGEKEPQAAAWSNLSAAYLPLNRFEEARRAAEEALALDPTDKDAVVNRDLALQRLGRAAGGKP